MNKSDLYDRYVGSGSGNPLSWMFDPSYAATAAAHFESIRNRSPEDAVVAIVKHTRVSARG